MFPALDDTNRGFWTGGADGILRLLRCRACGYWIHPPRPVCPKCWRRELGWEATSGRATLFTYTVNHKAWNPRVPVPYVVAVVELPEQDGLRLTTNIVDCSADDLVIGMPLLVTFEHDGEFSVPLFAPVVAEPPRKT